METLGAAGIGRRFDAGKSGYPGVGRSLGGDAKGIQRSKGQDSRQQRTRKPATLSTRVAGKTQEAAKHRAPVPERPSRQGGRKSFPTS